MKISVENGIRQYGNVAYNKLQRTSKAAGEVNAPLNRDQVIIGSSTAQIGEKKVAEELSRSILRDVRKATPQEKLDSLRQQIEEGTYRIDADQIVSKMLLEKGNE